MQVFGGWQVCLCLEQSAGWLGIRVVVFACRMSCIIEVQNQPKWYHVLYWAGPWVYGSWIVYLYVFGRTTVCLLLFDCGWVCLVVVARLVMSVEECEVYAWCALLSHSLVLGRKHDVYVMCMCCSYVGGLVVC